MADSGGNSGESQGQDPRHPKSTYSAKYPYNRVEVTESGHEIHKDDTPGKERLRYAHKSGTYREISPDGKLVELVVAHQIDYVKGGYTQTVDKNYDVKVRGSHRTDIDGDQHSEIHGTISQAVEGDHKTLIGGDHVSAVKGDMVHGVVGNTVFKIGKGIQVKGDNTIDTKIDAAANLQFGQDLLIESQTKITLKVGQSMIIIEPNCIQIISGTNVMNATQGLNKITGTQNWLRTDKGTKVESTSFPPIGKDPSC